MPTTAAKPTALVKAEHALPEVALTGCTFTERGLTIRAGMSADEIEDLAAQLLRLHSASGWAVGDALNEIGYRGGERRQSDAYDKLHAITGHSRSWLYNLAQVAKEFPPESRHPGLSMKHHILVLTLEDPNDRERWLARAEAEKITGEAMRLLLPTPKAQPRKRSRRRRSIQEKAALEALDITRQEAHRFHAVYELAERYTTHADHKPMWEEPRQKTRREGLLESALLNLCAIILNRPELARGV
ncbi:MAG: hypothetical protein JXA57_10635 [Armatimonadetes bacterium]|nr:hypothetical protein [Armatimonadota bacterium]